MPSPSQEVTIISCDLELFNLKLLPVAQSDMCWISSGIDSKLEAGTNRYSVICMFAELVGRRE